MALKVDYEHAPVSALEAELGRRLEAARLARNVSQADLAAEAGVSRRTITRLETGGGMSLDTLIRVMRALGVAERLETLLPDPLVQPVERVRRKGKPRRRARRTPPRAQAAWTWADTPEHTGAAADTADDTARR